ncbi:AraC family transcriptional regulator ligand-binding domain-containing protein [Inhella sp. 4Y17]|uniref:AraC family transcriptional regulator ligand-binding domain-containing protein n=1 Tax=Inhella gelatinilytica TaxID=2795030 RepID=A0A931IVS7_9BURK|nr:AraC family transcriptional regulator ligand-binding domain-containing protein [Inhella gelatinilytica]
MPPLAQARVARAYAQAALDEAQALGLGPPAWPEEAVPVPDYIAWLEAGGRVQGDFGVRVGTRMKASHFVAYGHVLLSCPRFGDAIEQTRRFEGLAHDLGRSELRLDGDQAIYRWHSPWLTELPGRQLTESIMASILSFATWLAGRRLPVLSLAFPHAAPADPLERAARDAAWGLAVQYDAPVTEARFPAALLSEPVPGADPALFPLLEQRAAQMLAARQQALMQHPAAENHLLTAVRAQIAERLAQDGARVAPVAAALHLSPRTLQRRLAEAGSSFQALLDATRRELARQYLRNPALSLTEIAFLLGYAEQSSFSHAVRAWEGCTPQQWRHQQT